MLLQQVSFTLSRLCLEDGAIVRLRDRIASADAGEAERMETEGENVTFVSQCENRQIVL